MLKHSQSPATRTFSLFSLHFTWYFCTKRTKTMRKIFFTFFVSHTTKWKQQLRWPWIQQWGRLHSVHRGPALGGGHYQKINLTIPKTTVAWLNTPYSPYLGLKIMRMVQRKDDRFRDCSSRRRRVPPTVPCGGGVDTVTRPHVHNDSSPITAHLSLDIYTLDIIYYLL